MCPRPLFALVAALGFLATTAGAEPGPTVVTDALIAPYFTARSAPAELRRAWRKLQAGRTKDARRRFARFLDRKPDHPMAGASGFLLGALLLEADDRAAAIDRFSAAAERWPLMADDARFRAANAALEIGDYARTQALCRAIPMASPWGPESRYLRGRALVLEDDPAARASGIALLEQLVADPAGAGDRDRIALSLARAYEQGERHADAGRVFDRLARENAGAWLGRKAASGLARLAPHLGAAVRRVVGAPTVAAHLAKAQSLLRRHRSDEVLSEVDAVLADARIRRGTEVWCEAQWLGGQAARKKRDHTDAAGRLGRFIDGCPDHPERERALYAAGLSHWTADETDEALIRFEMLWKTAENHRLADDAVHLSARIHLERGDHAVAQRLLDTQIAEFADGDMLDDAHWLSFLGLFDAGKFDEAVAYIDSIGDATGEDDAYTLGRLAYFRGRALDRAGRGAEALAAYEAVARDHPMSWYALLALNRLRAVTPARFRRAMRPSIRATASGEIVVPPTLEAHADFQRGLALLRLGLTTDARVAFDRTRREIGEDPDPLWALAAIFHRIGAWPISHNIARRDIAGFGTKWPTGVERAYYDIAFPRPFADHVRRWSKKRALDPALPWAIMREESGFNPRAESWANALGLMQLMLRTARDLARGDGISKRRVRRLRATDVKQPDLNVRLGTRYLARLLERYGKHPVLVIAGYNGGYGNLDGWLRARGDQPLDLWVERIPFGQTRHYTKRVATSYWTYRWLAASEDAPPDALVPTIAMKLPAAP